MRAKSQGTRITMFCLEPDEETGAPFFRPRLDRPGGELQRSCPEGNVASVLSGRAYGVIRLDEPYIDRRRDDLGHIGALVFQQLEACTKRLVGHVLAVDPLERAMLEASTDALVDHHVAELARAEHDDMGALATDPNVRCGQMRLLGGGDHAIDPAPLL